MPQNIAPANPTDVMPKLVCTAFNEQVRWESLVNQDYVDGSSDRAPLVTEGRSWFKLTAQLSPAQWQALRNFYQTHVGVPFYFYYLRETNPPFQGYDATGAKLPGRYTVVFDGGFSETYYSPGADASNTTTSKTGASALAQGQLALREVE